MNKAIKSFVVICVLVMVCAIGGVTAMWQYYGSVEDLTHIQQAVAIEEFYYSENLPDDEEGNLSHNSLLEKVVSKVEGINNSDSLLSQAINNRLEDNHDEISSNQQVSGGNLKKVFSTVEGFEYVGFLLVYKSETEYNIYTYDNRDTDKVGNTIVVYKTNIYLRDGVWVLSGGYEGTAEVCKYDGKTNGPYKNTINPSTFVRKQN